MKQVDKIWEEGINALVTGDLYLGLFSLGELEKVLNAFVRYPCDLAGAYGDDGVACVLNEVPEDKISAIEKRAEETVIEHRFPSALDIRRCVVIYPGNGSSGQELLSKIQEKVGWGSE